MLGIGPTIAAIAVVTIVATPACGPCDTKPRSTAHLDLPDLWSGDFSEDEKASILTYLESRDARFERAWTRILKEDLDGDAIPDYIVSVLMREAPDGQEAPVLAVLKHNKGQYAMVVHALRNQSLGFPGARRIYTIDFDADGLKDVVDQRFYHIGGGEAERYCLVLNFEGNSLTSVYSKMSYDIVEFRDLDGNGRYELIEMTNELGIPSSSFWPVLYEWTNASWVAAPESYPSYYAERAQLFRATLEAARKENAVYESKTGRPSPYNQLVIKTMEDYLSRVSQILGSE